MLTQTYAELIDRHSHMFVFVGIDPNNQTSGGDVSKTDHCCHLVLELGWCSTAG